MKNSNRPRDLQACRAVPQSTTPLRSPPKGGTTQDIWVVTVENNKLTQGRIFQIQLNDTFPYADLLMSSFISKYTYVMDF